MPEESIQMTVAAGINNLTISTGAHIIFAMANALSWGHMGNAGL